MISLVPRSHSERHWARKSRRFGENDQSFSVVESTSLPIPHHTDSLQNILLEKKELIALGDLNGGAVQGAQELRQA
jgi:hypothetical protein